MKTWFFVAGCSLMLMLCACGRTIVELPKGKQIVHGMLQPVAYSLKHRGTSALYTGSGGQLIAYAESMGVNLRQFFGMEVDLEGVFEANTDPHDFPVLIVSRVVSSDSQLRPWTIPSIGLSIKLPSSWKGTLKGGSAVFTSSGGLFPALTIIQQAAVNNAPSYGPAVLPKDTSGTPIVVGLRKATADLSADKASWVVRVSPPSFPQGGRGVDFTFAIDSTVPTAQQLSTFNTILASVSFAYAGTMPSSSKSSSSPSAVPTSSPAGFSSGSSVGRAAGEGAPCGGTAGILCPGGLYCRITDKTTQAGTCVKR